MHGYLCLVDNAKRELHFHMFRFQNVEVHLYLITLSHSNSFYHRTLLQSDVFQLTTLEFYYKGLGLEGI